MRRPTSIEEMRERLRDFRTSAALAAGQGISVRPDDVFVATYSKSGTTWMQHVVHGLRSAGSMDFREISAVVPWLESALDMGIDPDADQLWQPRAFKSHLMWRDLPKGGRYITVFRDPMSVLPSFYRFFEGWWFEAGSVSIEEFATEFYVAGSASGRHWDHLVDWWVPMERPDVLALSYEDMQDKPDRVPVVVGEFLGIEVDAATMDLVTRQSSRDYMAAHSSQFDEQLIRTARDHVWGLPAGGDAMKVTPGGPGIEVPDHVAAALAAAWQGTVQPELGFASYADFRRALPNPLGARR